MRMERPPAEGSMNGLFRAKYTTKYLEDYVDNKSHGGKTLRDRIQFNTHSKSKKKINGRRNLICINTTDGCERRVISYKFMMANGQSSLPKLPDFPRED
jgi:dimethylaniline monooxygenase (N-oxide forming)